MPDLNREDRKSPEASLVRKIYRERGDRDSSSAHLDCDPFFMLRGRSRGKCRQLKGLKLCSDFPGCSV